MNRKWIGAALFSFISDNFITAKFKVGLAWSSFHATTRTPGSFKIITRFVQGKWQREYIRKTGKEVGHMKKPFKVDYKVGKVIRQSPKLDQINNFYARRGKTRYGKR